MYAVSLYHVPVHLTLHDLFEQFMIYNLYQDLYSQMNTISVLS